VGMYPTHDGGRSQPASTLIYAFGALNRVYVGEETRIDGEVFCQRVRRQDIEQSGGAVGERIAAVSEEGGEELIAVDNAAVEVCDVHRDAARARVQYQVRRAVGQSYIAASDDG